MTPKSFQEVRGNADLILIPARSEEQGAFSDLISGNEYTNVSRDEAIALEQSALDAEVESACLGTDPEFADADQRYNAHFVDGDNQMMGYHVGNPRTPGL